MAPRLQLSLPLITIQQLAIPVVSLLISFLAYTSQYLFYHIDPGPLTRSEALWFNALVGAIWWCYFRACTVDPGPRGWVGRCGFEGEGEEATKEDGGDGEDGDGKRSRERSEDMEERWKQRIRWCRKCEAVKPPRAHHCRQCGRCIPKMDHHCPWTTNCVSLTTFPHFLRFVLYAVLSMSLLTLHLFVRIHLLWSNRHLPAYLGPPAWAIAHLLVLVAVNSITLFALAILGARATYSLAMNTTMIESWEIERHEAVVERARRNGGWVWASGGRKVTIRRQEFPYDVGVWRNLVAGMGTGNVIMWVLPFGGAPGVESAGRYEVNGFEDEGVLWPPFDPEKMPREERRAESEMGRLDGEVLDKEAFRRRQERDYERWERDRGGIADEDEDEEYESEYEEGMDGEEGWTNSDGDRLRDYGVDEEAEGLVDDDDVPLAELLRRRKAK